MKRMLHVVFQNVPKLSLKIKLSDIITPVVMLLLFIIDIITSITSP